MTYFGGDLTATITSGPPIFKQSPDKEKRIRVDYFLCMGDTEF